MVAALEAGAAFYLLALLTASFIVIYKVAGLPSPAALLALAEGWMKDYGLISVFVASLIEGLFVVGSYFPGSVIILSVTLISAHGAVSLVQVIISSLIGLWVAVMVNYTIGYYGVYRLLEMVSGQAAARKSMAGWLLRRPILTVGLLGIHANLMSLGVVCLGIARVGFLKTVGLAMLSFMVWVPLELWVIANIGGELSSAGSSSAWYFAGFFGLIGLGFSTASFVGHYRARATRTML